MKGVHGLGMKKRCIDNCFLPVTPHLLFPQFLNEGIEEERRLGIAMVMELLALCDEVWVFGEATEGMAAEIASATAQGKEIIFKDTEECKWEVN